MSLTDRIAELVEDVAPVDVAAYAEARERYDGLVKPPGSLGRLEEAGARLAAIARACPPPVPSEPAVVVAAADHGVHAQGVTPWPQAITTQMVEVFCEGKAAVNALARAVGVRVSVLDVGCATEPKDHPLLRKRRVRSGTADLSLQPAMSRDDAERAFLAGAGMAEELVGNGVDLLITGDMGIANTTASACLVAAFTGHEAQKVTGPGAGADEQALAVKTAVVSEALALHQPDPSDPIGVLAAVGGLEHAAIAGLICSAAADGVPVVLDGVITNAAALAATALCPAAGDYLFAGHRSTEPGAAIALAALGLDPLLDLQLRVGEGAGGVLAVPLLQSAATALRDMASLSDLS